MQRLGLKILLLVSMLLVASCDSGANCVEPIDYGNLSKKEINPLLANPFDNSNSPTNSCEYDGSIGLVDGFVCHQESCPTYSYWYDTGVDIDNTNLPVVISASGVVEFCGNYIAAPDDVSAADCANFAYAVNSWDEGWVPNFSFDQEDVDSRLDANPSLNVSDVINDLGNTAACQSYFPISYDGESEYKSKNAPVIISIPRVYRKCDGDTEASYDTTGRFDNCFEAPNLQYQNVSNGSNESSISSYESLLSPIKIATPDGEESIVTYYGDQYYDFCQDLVDSGSVTCAEMSLSERKYALRTSNLNFVLDAIDENNPCAANSTYNDIWGDYSCSDSVWSSSPEVKFFRDAGLRLCVSEDGVDCSSDSAAFRPNNMTINGKTWVYGGLDGDAVNEVLRTKSTIRDFPEMEEEFFRQNHVWILDAESLDAIIYVKTNLEVEEVYGCFETGSQFYANRKPKKSLCDQLNFTEHTKKYPEDSCLKKASKCAEGTANAGADAFRSRSEPDILRSNSGNIGGFTVSVSKAGATCVASTETLYYKVGVDGEEIALGDLLENGSYSFTPVTTGRVYIRIADNDIEGNFCNANTLAASDDGIEAGDNYTNDDAIRQELEKIYSNMRVNIYAFSEDEATLFSGLFDTVVKPFQVFFSEDLHKNIFLVMVAEDGFLHRILSLFITLYITFLGVYFVSGLSDIKQGDIVIKLIRIGAVYTFLSPTGWTWFYHIMYFFETGAEQIALQFSGALTSEGGMDDVTDTYALLDLLTTAIFQDVIQTKISALLFSPFSVGWIMVLLFYASFYFILQAVVKAILIYIMIKLMFSILFIVGPIFISLMIFEFSKGIFTRWLNMLTSYSLQLIFLFTVVNFFAYFLFNLFYSIFGYGACWEPVWIFSAGDPTGATDGWRFTLLSFWKVAGADPRYSLAYNVNQGPDFVIILFFLIMSYMFLIFIDKATELADKISGEAAGGFLTGGNAAGGVGFSLAGRLFSDMKEAMGEAIEKVGGAVASGAFKSTGAVFRTLINPSDASAGSSFMERLGTNYSRSSFKEVKRSMRRSVGWKTNQEFRDSRSRRRARNEIFKKSKKDIDLRSKAQEQAGGKAMSLEQRIHAYNELVGERLDARGFTKLVDGQRIGEKAAVDFVTGDAAAKRAFNAATQDKYWMFRFDKDPNKSLGYAKTTKEEAEAKRQLVEIDKKLKDYDTKILNKDRSISLPFDSKSKEELIKERDELLVTRAEKQREIEKKWVEDLSFQSNYSKGLERQPEEIERVRRFAAEALKHNYEIDGNPTDQQITDYILDITDRGEYNHDDYYKPSAPSEDDVFSPVKNPINDPLDDNFPEPSAPFADDVFSPTNNPINDPLDDPYTKNPLHDPSAPSEDEVQQGSIDDINDQSSQSKAKGSSFLDEMNEQKVDEFLQEELGDEGVMDHLLKRSDDAENDKENVRAALDAKDSNEDEQVSIEDEAAGKIQEAFREHRKRQEEELKEIEEELAKELDEVLEEGFQDNNDISDSDNKEDSSSKFENELAEDFVEADVVGVRDNDPLDINPDHVDSFVNDDSTVNNLDSDKDESVVANPIFEGEDPSLEEGADEGVINPIVDESDSSLDSGGNEGGQASIEEEDSQTQEAFREDRKRQEEEAKEIEAELAKELDEVLEEGLQQDNNDINDSDNKEDSSSKFENELAEDFAEADVVGVRDNDPVDINPDHDDSIVNDLDSDKDESVVTNPIFEGEDPSLDEGDDEGVINPIVDESDPSLDSGGNEDGQASIEEEDSQIQEEEAKEIEEGFEQKSSEEIQDSNVVSDSDNEEDSSSKFETELAEDFAEADVVGVRDNDPVDINPDHVDSFVNDDSTVNDLDSDKDESVVTNPIFEGEDPSLDEGDDEGVINPIVDESDSSLDSDGNEDEQVSIEEEDSQIQEEVEKEIKEEFQDNYSDNKQDNSSDFENELVEDEGDKISDGANTSTTFDKNDDESESIQEDSALKNEEVDFSDLENVTEENISSSKSNEESNKQSSEADSDSSLLEETQESNESILGGEGDYDNRFANVSTASDEEYSAEDTNISDGVNTNSESESDSSSDFESEPAKEDSIESSILENEESYSSDTANMTEENISDSEADEESISNSKEEASDVSQVQNVDSSDEVAEDSNIGEKSVDDAEPIIENISSTLSSHEDNDLELETPIDESDLTINDVASEQLDAEEVNDNNRFAKNSSTSDNIDSAFDAEDESHVNTSKVDVNSDIQEPFSNDETSSSKHDNSDSSLLSSEEAANQQSKRDSLLRQKKEEEENKKKERKERKEEEEKARKEKDEKDIKRKEEEEKEERLAKERKEEEEKEKQKADALKESQEAEANKAKEDADRLQSKMESEAQKAQQEAELAKAAMDADDKKAKQDAADELKRQLEEGEDQNEDEDEFGKFGVDGKIGVDANIGAGEISFGAKGSVTNTQSPTEEAPEQDPQDYPDRQVTTSTKEERRDEKTAPSTEKSSRGVGGIYSGVNSAPPGQGSPGEMKKPEIKSKPEKDIDQAAKRVREEAREVARNRELSDLDDGRAKARVEILHDIGETRRQMMVVLNKLGMNINDAIKLSGDMKQLSDFGAQSHIARDAEGSIGDSASDLEIKENDALRKEVESSLKELHSSGKLELIAELNRLEDEMKKLYQMYHHGS